MMDGAKFSCENFQPQKWRKDMCRNCYQPFRVHGKKSEPTSPLSSPGKDAKVFQRFRVNREKSIDHSVPAKERTPQVQNLEGITAGKVAGIVEIAPSLDPRRPKSPPSDQPPLPKPQPPPVVTSGVPLSISPHPPPPAVAKAVATRTSSQVAMPVKPTVTRTTSGSKLPSRPPPPMSAIRKPPPPVTTGINRGPSPTTQKTTPAIEQTSNQHIESESVISQLPNKEVNVVVAEHTTTEEVKLEDVEKVTEDEVKVQQQQLLPEGSVVDSDVLGSREGEGEGGGEGEGEGEGQGQGEGQGEGEVEGGGEGEGEGEGQGEGEGEGEGGGEGEGQGGVNTQGQKAGEELREMGEMGEVGEVGERGEVGEMGEVKEVMEVNVAAPMLETSVSLVLASIGQNDIEPHADTEEGEGEGGGGEGESPAVVEASSTDSPQAVVTEVAEVQPQVEGGEEEGVGLEESLKYATSKMAEQNLSSTDISADTGAQRDDEVGVVNDDGDEEEYEEGTDEPDGNLGDDGMEETDGGERTDGGKGVFKSIKKRLSIKRKPKQKATEASPAPQQGKGCTISPCHYMTTGPYGVTLSLYGHKGYTESPCQYMTTRPYRVTLSLYDHKGYTESPCHYMTTRAIQSHPVNIIMATSRGYTQLPVNTNLCTAMYIHVWS